MLVTVTCVETHTSIIYVHMRICILLYIYLRIYYKMYTCEVRFKTEWRVPRIVRHVFFYTANNKINKRLRNEERLPNIQWYLQLFLLIPSWELTYPFPKACLEGDFPFPVWWDMLVPWRENLESLNFSNYHSLLAPTWTARRTTSGSNAWARDNMLSRGPTMFLEFQCK